SAIRRSLSSPIDSLSHRLKAQLSVAEALEVFILGAGKEIEKRVEAAIERPAKLRNRAVDGVQGQTGLGAVVERDRGVLSRAKRAVWHEAKSVNQCVASHCTIVRGDAPSLAAGTGDVSFLSCAVDSRLRTWDSGPESA